MLGRVSRVVVVVLALAVAVATATDPDENRDCGELISSKGYPVERHWVETADHYVLNIFRIPRPGSPPVFLQHGLLDSSDTWVLNYANNSLAFILYDAGFDVFLGNSRGNKYSRNNTVHHPNWPFNGPFWDFTWDDMAQHDLPAAIGYVLHLTGAEKLSYIGHSQGTTQAFANFATPEWSVADKVNVFVALAPVAYVYNTPDILIKALADLDFDTLIKFLGVHEFLPTSKLLQWLLPEVCKVTPLLCESVIYLFAGLDLGDLDKSRLPVYTAHFPSGTSVNDMSHWAQGARDNAFQQYDFGLIGNELHYHQSSPPQYDIGSMYSPPTALFTGSKDTLSDPKDDQVLIQTLPEKTVVLNDNTQAYAHLDFVWGEHAYQTIYPKIVELLLTYA